MRMYDIFWIGYDLKYVDLSRFMLPQVKSERYLLWVLESLKGRLEDYKINSGILRKVSRWIQKLSKSYEGEQAILPDDAAELTRDAEEWGTLIQRELLQRVVFESFSSGALNQTALLNTSEGKSSPFFEEKIWNALSEIEKNDFSNSAKCLLVGLPTPAVMVALRGAEATVKKYYEHKTSGSAKEKVWGSIIKELKAKSEELKIEPTFLGYLDYIRDAKRNFAEHPNKIYDQREAELIFMEIVNLVQDTYAEIV